MIGINIIEDVEIVKVTFENESSTFSWSRSGI